ncbi:MAG: hypothetical protein GY696_37545 [Gammaproteobacteria bacterium]|nr:hypothetical protein [Gammaproteobacteria bacterium]
MQRLRQERYAEAADALTLASAKDPEQAAALLKELITEFRSHFAPKGHLGPTIKCVSCSQLFFRDAVIELDMQKVERVLDTIEKLKDPIKMTEFHIQNISLLLETIYISFANAPMDEQLFMCNGCWNRFRAKIPSTPPSAYWNGLELDPIPPQLQLNELSIQLLAQRIPFMKLLSLPAGGQAGVRGGVINVPADYTGTVEKLLPHNLSDGQIVAVKLKKKVEYRGHDNYQYIVIDEIQAGLKWLIENNKFYADVQTNRAWVSQSTADDPDTVQSIIQKERDLEAEANIPEDENEPLQTNPIMDSVFAKVIPTMGL